MATRAKEVIDAAGASFNGTLRPTSDEREIWDCSLSQFKLPVVTAALPSGGRIIIHEMLMDDDLGGPWPVAAFSVLMLLGTKRRQFSLPELRPMLERSGFADVREARTGGGCYSLVSTQKP